MGAPELQWPGDDARQQVGVGSPGDTRWGAGTAPAPHHVPSGPNSTTWERPPDPARPAVRPRAAAFQLVGFLQK